MKMMKYFALAVGTILSTLFTLSSCTQQTTPSLLTSTSNATDVTNKILTDVPFGYDVAMDTISYNSCVGSGLNSSGILHGLKIGANEGFVDSTDTGAVKAGIKLNSAFLQYIAKSVEPTFPNTSVVPSQIQYILENSEKNKDLTIQYAVRSKSNLYVVQDVIDASKTAGTYTLTRDGIYENAYLSQDPVLTALTKNVVFGPNKTIAAEGPRVYNLGSGSSPDPIEASLGFSAAFDETYQAQAGVDDGTGAGENYSDLVRERFNSGQQLLTVTFGNQSITSSSDSTTSFGLNSPRRPNETNLARAYGKGYDLTFVTKSSAVPSQRRNILAQITEKNLETGTPVSGASWSCENYVIMKTNQWNNKKATEPACSEVNASDLADPTFGPTLKAKIARLRRHYSDTFWGIGFLIRENTIYNPATRPSQPLCVVNKSIDCYLPTTQILSSAPDQDIGVNYSAATAGNTSECYLSRYQQMGVTYIGNKSGDTARLLGRCPQFASVCVRTSTSY